MSYNVEFRGVITFLLLKKTSSQEIIAQLQDVYKSNCPCKATIYNWIRDSIFAIIFQWHRRIIHATRPMDKVFCSSVTTGITEIEH